MNFKDFDNRDEAEAFASTQMYENDCTVDMLEVSDTVFRISWIKNKKYIAHDGKEFTDQVWTKADGSMILCQDLDVDHARNIIRMVLRNEQAERQLAGEMLASVMAILETGEEADSDETPRTLH